MINLLKAILLLIIITSLVINLKLYYQPDFNSLNDGDFNIDLLYQLNHLENRIHAGAHREMQKLYPEGFVFMAGLYGLFWCNFIEKLPEDHKLNERDQMVYRRNPLR